MNRDNIDILDYLPDIIKDVTEYQEIANAENPSINSLWGNHRKAFNNQFINTLDEQGCARWGKMLDITPKGTATIEDRRLAILARINTSLPYTYRQLENFLRNICADDYTMTLDNENYTLTVLIIKPYRYRLLVNYTCYEIRVEENFSDDVNEYLELESYSYASLEDYTLKDIAITL